MLKEQFVSAIAPSKFGELFEAGLDLVPGSLPFGGGEKKKEDSEKDDEKSSNCGHEELDMGDGPADWIFDPEKLRDLFHHGNKKWEVELKENSLWL